MLQPVRIVFRGQEVVLSCRHAKSWPPAWAKLGLSPEFLLDTRHFTPAQYERAKTWQRVCGLLEMDAAKCVSCPFSSGPDGTPIGAPPKTPFRLEKPKPKSRAKGGR